MKCACGETDGPFPACHTLDSCTEDGGAWMPAEMWNKSKRGLITEMHERAREITRLSIRLEEAERLSQKAYEHAKEERAEMLEWKAAATTLAVIVAKERP